MHSPKHTYMYTFIHCSTHCRELIPVVRRKIHLSNMSTFVYIQECKDGVLWCKDGVLWCKDGVLWCKDGVLWCKVGVLWCKDGVLWCKVGVLWVYRFVAICVYSRNIFEEIFTIF